MFSMGRRLWGALIANLVAVRDGDHQHDRHRPRGLSVAVTSGQLALIAAAADSIGDAKRQTFLDRVAAQLRVDGRCKSDSDLEKLLRLVATSLSPVTRRRSAFQFEGD